MKALREIRDLFGIGAEAEGKLGMQYQRADSRLRRYCPLAPSAYDALGQAVRDWCTNSAVRKSRRQQSRDQYRKGEVNNQTDNDEYHKAFDSVWILDSDRFQCFRRESFDNTQTAPTLFRRASAARASWQACLLL
jgi:hypothetical protein